MCLGTFFSKSGICYLLYSPSSLCCTFLIYFFTLSTSAFASMYSLTSRYTNRLLFANPTRCYLGNFFAYSFFISSSIFLYFS